MQRGSHETLPHPRRTRIATLATCAALSAALAGCTGTRAAGRGFETAEIERALELSPSTPAAPLVDEHLTYALALSGLPVGSATFETRVNGDDVEMVAEGGTNAVLDVFYPVHGLARARLDASGDSRTFFLSVDENGKSTERALTFAAMPCLYYRPWNDEPWVAILAQFRAPIDPLGLLLKLRRLDPDAQTHDFEVAMTMRSFCYRARCVDRRRVLVPAGEFADAWIWQVEVRPYEKLSPREDDATEVGAILGFYEVAISSDGRRLPLQLTREFGFGQVTLNLRSIDPGADVASVAATTRADAADFNGE